jgi:hypothetical protein
MGVEIRINTLDQQGGVNEEVIPLRHPEEEVDKTIQFGIHVEGEFRHHIYLEPVEGSALAFRAYRTEDPQSTDLPGTVKKKEARSTYIDMVTPANPVILHSGENGMVFSAHISHEVVSLKLPQELFSDDQSTAAD